MATVKFMTPIGVARFPKINKPDTKFDAEGVYTLDVIFDDADLKEIEKQIKEFASKELPKVKDPQLPISESKPDKDGEVVTFVRFKSKRKPIIIDAKRNKVPENVVVGGGSKVRVAGTLNAYEKGKNKGVNIYLNAVQVIELHAGFNVDDFDEYEGDEAFVVEDTGEASEFDL